MMIRSAPAALWRTEAVAMAALAAPLAAANLLQMLVYAIDVIFVARLGEQALAAASLATTLFGLMIWCFSGLTGACAPLIAAELGRRQHAVREVRRTVRMALWLAVLCGVAGMAVCLAGERLLLLSGQDAEVARLAGPPCCVISFRRWAVRSWRPRSRRWQSLSMPWEITCLCSATSARPRWGWMARQFPA